MALERGDQTRDRVLAGGDVDAQAVAFRGFAW